MIFILYLYHMQPRILDQKDVLRISYSKLHTHLSRPYCNIILTTYLLHIRKILPTYTNTHSYDRRSHTCSYMHLDSSKPYCLMKSQDTFARASLVASASAAIALCIFTGKRTSFLYRQIIIFLSYSSSRAFPIIWGRRNGLDF